ncbi:MAG: hypothetical protein AAF065_06700 [Verrucomicrobiota bacterium]
MDDFETFKATRVKMDPSSHKMSEKQWQQAYTAYRSSRKRVAGSTSSTSSKSKRRRRTTSSSPAPRVSHKPSSIAPSNQLRNEVRLRSAYTDLRLLVDVLSWVVLGVVVLAAAVKLVYYTNISVALVALLDAVVWVVAVFGLRLLVHVIIDIPDIALYKALKEPVEEEDSQATGE